MNDIVTTTKKEENKIRAISALQSIESDIFNIYKQLPEIRIEEINNSIDKEDDNPQLEDTPTMDGKVWGSEPTPTPTSSSIDGDAILSVIETTTTTTSPSPNTSSTTSKEEKERKTVMFGSYN